MVGSLCITEAKAKLPGHCSCTYLNPASHPHTEGLQGDDVTFTGTARGGHRAAGTG